MKLKMTIQVYVDQNQGNKDYKTLLEPQYNLPSR